MFRNSDASNDIPWYCQRHDIFAFNPSYEWTSHKTRTGMVLSYLTIAFLVFYIVLTTRDYVVRPPELVSQGDIDLLQVAREIPFRVPRFGIRVGYTDTGEENARVAALHNENPYVRFQMKHVVMKDQERVRETDLKTEECIVSSIKSQCPVVKDSETDDNIRLKGIYYKQDYEFVEILVRKCTGDPSCAPLEEINELIQSGAFRIRAQLSLEAQQFDVERFHVTGKGYTISNRSFEYFNLPDVELHSDIVMQARKISKEQRYIGSPPMPETEIDVLSFRSRETNFRPRTTNETLLMAFQIKLADSVLLEEVNYWCPSILDLFGLWGAMASFAASLSLGFIAYQYNKWHFYRHFHHAALQKRRDAQQMTLASMKWVRNNDANLTPNRNDIYDNLQTQYDALMIQPDIRLFESHHFNKQGRMAMTAMELKIPTTAFGELRRIAVLEHAKKKRAAQFLSVWYARHLVKKGFVRDEKRRRELFSPPDEGLVDGGSTKNYMDDNSFLQQMGDGLQQVGDGLQQVGSGLMSNIRRRKGNADTSSVQDSTTDEMMAHTKYDDLEKGVTPRPPGYLPQELVFDNSTPASIKEAADRRVLEVIAAMNFGAPQNSNAPR